MTDWFAKVPPRVASSIAPVPQDKPGVVFTLILFGVALLGVVPFLYVFACALGVLP